MYKMQIAKYWNPTGFVLQIGCIIHQLLQHDWLGNGFDEFLYAWQYNADFFSNDIMLILKHHHLKELKLKEIQWGSAINIHNKKIIIKTKFLFQIRRDIHKK